jgi:nickel-dependent lactate racemase
LSTVAIRYGEDTLDVTVPDDRDVAILEPPTPGEPRPVDDAAAPLLSVIAEAARGRGSVAVLVPDDSRPFPVAEILPRVLDAIAEAGVPESAVRVLVATGLHRAMPADALETHLGAAVLARVPVRNHDARDPETLTEVDTLANGVPLLVAREAAEADLRVLLGTFEPHQYHGFSGGHKVLAIGCAGEATIAHTHGRAFLADDRLRPGSSPGNPFRAFVSETGRRAGPAVALNLIPGPDRLTTYGAAAGDPDDVWAGLALRGEKVFGSEVAEPADVIVTGVPAPKSRSLYQSTRAATNLVLCSRPALKPGGTLVLAAPCEDGVGNGEGERRFGRALRERAASILTDDDALAPGEQRAWMMAYLMRDHRIVVAGARRPGEFDGLGLETVDAPDTILDATPGRVLIVPDGLHVLPR